MNYNFKRI